MKKREAWETEDVDRLFETIVRLRNKDEAKRFLRDLMTEKELLEMANRWKVVRMLDAGVSYADIEGETGMSSTTIARIAKWMKEGKGGYALMLERTK
jgi:TrpR-related protein YerC/YecD